MPVKKNTSDLERTLPGWLRDVRKASSEGDNQLAAEPGEVSEPVEPVALPPEKPVPPKQKAPASPLDFLAGLSQASDDEEDTPDWLKSLQNSMPAPVEPIPAPEPPAEQPADWLSSLESEAQSNQPPVASELNWGFDDQPATYNFDENANAASQSSEAMPDWLAALKAQDEAAHPTQKDSTSTSQIDGEQPPSDGTSPDWLSSLGEITETAPEQTPTDNALAADAPDWLSSLGEITETAPEQTPADNALAADAPDWLASLGEIAETAPEQTPADNAPAAEAPDWLASLMSASQPAEPVAAEPTLEMGTVPGESQPVESDAPSWMMDLQAPPAAHESDVEEAVPAADVPDWISGIQGEQPEPESQPADLVEPAPVTGELPSWLAAAMGEKPADQPEEPPSPRKPFQTGALGELGPLDDGGELPDWMSKLGESIEIPKPVEISQESALGEAPGEAELPVSFETIDAVAAADQKAGITAEDGEQVVLPPEPAAIEPAPDEAGTPAPLPAYGEEQNLDSILSLDMPDWLSGFTPTEAELSDAVAAEKLTEDNLRPADLPSWVQAMRPVEDVMGERIDEAEEQQVESHGPLAGLRNVLPVQPGIPDVHKPKVYSIKLQVDETQRAQAALLENILNSESTPQAVSRHPEALIIRPLRWAIAGVLLAAVLLGALLQDIVGSPVFPAPDMPAGQSGIGAFKDTIAGLPDDATVLVVVDYQPGFAGELELAAGPVIKQLMSKNVRLAFISTSPIGSYLAERFLQKFTAQYPYELGAQYVNLGYLPGGAGGIQVFAELPGKTVGQDLFLGNLWDKDALKAVTIENVTKLSYFSTLLVLTDNPDTGRLWIEQAEPSLRPQPMLMVVSAQAEPMIRPYLVSGQLKGLLAGLEDGILYENQMTGSGQARSSWDAFGVAVFAAELLIMVGGVWGLIEGARTRRAKKMEQDEA
jgi:hypothetical protein